MKYEYERTDLTITEFDIEDKITTSATPVGPTRREKENAYNSYRFFDSAPGSWD